MLGASIISTPVVIVVSPVCAASSGKWHSALQYRGRKTTAECAEEGDHRRSERHGNREPRVLPRPMLLRTAARLRDTRSGACTGQTQRFDPGRNAFCVVREESLSVLRGSAQFS